MLAPYALPGKLTKIYQLHPTFRSQQNVIPFDITVDSFVVMKMLKSLEGENCIIICERIKQRNIF